MLFGAVEVGFSTRKRSLPGPSIDLALVNGAGYSDEYLFEAVDGPPKARKPKYEQPPPDSEGGTISLPKSGGHKFAPTPKKQ